MKFLRNLSKQKLQMLILVVIGALIGLGLVANFYVASAWHTLTAKRGVVKKLQEQIEDSQGAIKKEVVLTEVRDQTKVFVDGQQSRMVAGDSFSWIVREISALANPQPIRLLGMRPGVKTAHPHKPRYNVFSTQLEVEGTYDQLGQFIKSLENSFPTGEIRSLELISSDPVRALCHANITLSMVMLPEPEKSAAKTKSDPESAS